LKRSSATKFFLRQTGLKRFGAMSLGARPSSHVESQKLARLPFPIVTSVLARKSCVPASLHGTSYLTHGRSGSVHSYHSHLSQRATLKCSRSRIPSPPKHLGLLTLVHLTRQCSPPALVPFHKKPRRILSNLLKAHFLIANIVRKYVGIDESTEFTSLSLSALLRNLPFHKGSLFAILSIRGCICTLPGLPKCNGRPK
jgi:hypothetical protein